MKALLTALAQRAQTDPDSIALRSGERRLSYAHLQRAVEQATRQFRLNGVASLGIFLDNGCDWIIADLAAAAAGIRVVPLPWFFSDRQIGHAIEDGGVDFIVYAGQAPAGIIGTGAPLRFGLESRLLVIAAARRIGNDSAIPSGKLSYTSGSTGAPRGIALSYEFIENTSRAICLALGELGIESHLSMLPYATLLENIAGVYVPLMLGKTVCAESAEEIGLSAELRIDPARLKKTFNRLQPDSLILTPQLLALFCQLAESGAIDPTCLSFVAVGGARVGEFLLRRARRAGIPAYEGYGLTEFGSVATLNTPLQDRIGSVGKPLPGVSIECAEDGEILLRAAMAPSAGDSDRHESALVATGDYGSIDADGFLQVHGRKSSLIVLSNGRNVSPEWIETEIETSAVVTRGFVFSNDESQLSALLVASSAAVSDNELAREIGVINQGLPAYAQIKNWHRMPYPFTTDNQMLTDNGRLRRPQIRQALARLMTDSRTCPPPPGGAFSNFSLPEINPC